MGLKYLWDTNTAIYYLQNVFPESAEKTIDQIINTYQPAISVITEIELLCWKTATENDLIILHDFVKDCVVFPLDEDIKLKTIELRKKYKFKLPDAVIAASALVHNLVLITRNTIDFKNVDGLDLLNVHEN